MSNYLAIPLTFALGLIAGAFYFGGLWWTLQTIRRGRKPAIAIVSFFVRLSAVAACFYLVALSGSFLRVMVCLVGFLAARVLMVRRLGKLNAA